MESNNREETEERLAEFIKLEHWYTEMGEYLHKLSLELGAVSETDDRLFKEFKELLSPLGFFVWQVDKIEHPCPPREVYQIRVCRKLPIEMGLDEVPIIGV